MFYTLGSWLIVAVMALRAVWLWFAWHGTSALPMQWGLTGNPTWYASRSVALGLMPVMAVCIVALVQFAPREPSAVRAFHDGAAVSGDPDGVFVFGAALHLGQG